MKRSRRLITTVTLLVVIVFSLILSSCATPIGAIKKSPSMYAGKIIVIGGKVVRVFSIPFSRAKIIKIDDGTGSMYLLSERRKVKYGAYMTFSGEVVVIGGKGAARNMERAVRQVSNFLIRNKLANRSTVKQMSRVVIEFVRKLFRDKNAFVFFIEKD